MILARLKKWINDFRFNSSQELLDFIDEFEELGECHEAVENCKHCNICRRCENHNDCDKELSYKIDLDANNDEEFNKLCKHNLKS